MDDEERQHLEALLQTHLTNLHHLEAQAAKYGGDVPLSIHNGIVDEKSKIAHIQTKLATCAPTSDRSSLQHLRRQALTAYFQKQWEQAVDLLAQLMATDLGDDDTQKKLIEAKRQLRLQEDYHAACDLRDDGQWRAVLAAMDDIARRHPQYPDPEGLRQWAMNRQKEEMSAETVTDKTLLSTILSRWFYRPRSLSRLVIPFSAVLFLGIVVFVALWAEPTIPPDFKPLAQNTSAGWEPGKNDLTLPLGTLYKYSGERMGNDCRIALPPTARSNTAQPWVNCQAIGEPPPPATLTIPPGFKPLAQDTSAGWEPGRNEFTLPLGTLYKYSGERRDNDCRIALLPPAQPWVNCQAIGEPPPPPTSAPPPPATPTIPPGFKPLAQDTSAGWEPGKNDFTLPLGTLYKYSGDCTAAWPGPG
jgi:hypothetical protein